MILSGRYELLTRIGRGGMGQVWAGRDVLLGRKVAVKTVHLESPEDTSLAARFHREAVATAALNHPGIVTVHDAGIDGGTAFLVMELVGGQDLARTLRERGALPLAEAARIGESVAAALAAAHAIGVVHRDIKPANVLLDGDRVKVVDFGIAALAQSAQTSLTAPGTTLGTAEYMSPEQAMAEPVTPAADVYSLGCLLTTLVTGRPPFTGEHPLAVLNQQVQATPAPLRDARAEAPAELERLVAAMLAKDPAARPSATEVRATLARLRDTRAPSAAAAATVPALPVVPAPPAEAESTPAVAHPPTKALPLPLAPVLPTRPQSAEPPVPTTSRASGTGPPPISGPADAPPKRPRGRRRVIAIVGVATALALLALGFSLGNQQPDVAPTPAAPSIAPTTTPSPAPTPTSSSTLEPPAGPSLPVALEQLRAAIASLDSEGSAKARGDLLEAFDTLAREVQDGDLGKAERRVRELTRDLDKFVRDGKVMAAQAAPIGNALDAVSTALADTRANASAGRGGDAD